MSKKSINRSHQIRTDCRCFRPTEKMLLPSEDTRSRWAHCVRLCWSLALLVGHTSHLLAGFPGELSKERQPTAGAGDAPSEPSLAPPPDAAPTSVVSLWEAPRFMQWKMKKKH